MQSTKGRVIILASFLAGGILLLFLVVSFGGMLSAPQVTRTSPTVNAENVGPNAAIIIEFNKPLKRREVQASLSPVVHGEWKFQDPLVKNHLFQTLTFVPAVALKAGTVYTVILKNVQGFGFAEPSKISFSFRTTETEQSPLPEPQENEEEKQTQDSQEEPLVTLLDIPVDWQDSPLSCEAASLKMALQHKGVVISETEIMEKIGFDLTPRQGNIWGNPHKAFVGDIEGKICSTGFGVFWEAVARAANNWEDAVAFSGWTVQDLVAELDAGNPVVVWGTLPKATLTDCSWYTKSGELITAYRETHVRVAIGFLGLLKAP